MPRKIFAYVPTILCHRELRKNKACHMMMTGLFLKCYVSYIVLLWYHCTYERMVILCDQNCFACAYSDCINTSTKSNNSRGRPKGIHSKRQVYDAIYYQNNKERIRYRQNTRNAILRKAHKNG